MIKDKVSHACTILIKAFVVVFFCQCANSHDHTLPETVDFNYHIRPILSQNCYTCHGPDPSSRKATLRLDTYDGATAKLENGHRAIVPGRSGRSSIMERITSHDENVIMPPPESKKVLAAREIQLIEKWIDQGAKWKKHWAFISPSETKLTHNSIDQFIDSKLENLGLAKGTVADKNSLIRRVAYILTGLPPSIGELETLANKTHENIVDYYLETKHFGERWARHWMDLVRYAEGKGHEFDFDIHGAWHYRDYLIRAFNEDLPYDELVREHLAGDLLEQPRINKTTQVNESIIGTAYAFLGEGKHSPVDLKQEEADQIDNLIDVTSKTFQGLTISCAKCHDHKFDPIPTTDYYAMYGMFESTKIGPIAFNRNPRAAQIKLKAEEVNSKFREKIEVFIDNIDLQHYPTTINVIGDFKQSDFGEWYTSGNAFGEKPLLGKYASSRYFGHGIAGTLRSPTFTVQDSFIYFYANGHQSTVRLVVDNFQIIRDPLWGSLDYSVEDEKWALHRMDVSSVIGRKAFLELMPGRHYGADYQLDSANYLEVQQVFTSDKRITIDNENEYAAQDSSELEAWIAQKNVLSATLRDSNFIFGMNEGDAVFSPVFVRGNYKDPSESKVPHGFISVLSAGGKTYDQKGSGRLGWAESVADSGNPLTARVMVNRIWHHIFGRGIVESVDNFGLQGTLPSHPELLDFLAIDFMANGWSIKQTIRKIMLTETFKRGTKVDLLNAQKDPKNVYLASFPVRRIEGESVRDGILQVAGNLDRQMFGLPIPLHLTEFMTGRGRPGVSGPLDGHGRRSIYMAVKRNFLSPMMLTFDMPIPFSTFGNRNVTNVPAQSLYLMNDPFVHDQARKWAENIIIEESALEKRIEKIYLGAFGRKPSGKELEEGMEMIADFETDEEIEAWANFCHIIFNTKEFIHLI